MRQTKILHPRDALQQGIKVVFQEIALVSEFTVAENIFLEQHPVGRTGSINWRKLRREARGPVQRVGFDVDVDAAHRLVAGQQAADGRDRPRARPRSEDRRHGRADLLADPERGRASIQVIRRLTALGIAVLYVSHKLDEIFEIADTVTVLRDGRHISTKPVSEHTNDTLVQDMIGRHHRQPLPARAQGGS